MRIRLAVAVGAVLAAVITIFGPSDGTRGHRVAGLSFCAELSSESTPVSYILTKVEPCLCCSRIVATSCSVSFA